MKGVIDLLSFPPRVWRKFRIHFRNDVILNEFSLITHPPLIITPVDTCEFWSIRTSCSINECEFIIGIGKEGFINKLAALIALNFNAHKDTKSSYKKQLSLINSEMKIIDVKKNIFFMTDIFYTKFNT